MNLFSSFEPENEFKVYNSCKYSQITCRTMYITIIQYDPWTYPLQFLFSLKFENELGNQVFRENLIIFFL